MARDDAGPRRATLVAAAVQAAAVVAVVWVGSESEELRLDPWRPVVIAALLLVPAVLAVMSLRARPALLPAAATTSAVLAVVGFSLHSVVFLPVALVYLVAYSRVEQREANERIAPALVCSLLVLAAFAVPLLHEDPACYARTESGEVSVDRSPGDVTSGSESISADSAVIEGGCTSDTVVWWEAMGSIALSGIAVGTGVAFASPVRPRPREQTPSSPSK